MKQYRWVILLIAVSFLCGCANTWGGLTALGWGIVEDSRQLWQKVIGIDKQIEEEYW